MGETCHQEEVEPVILLRMRTARVRPGVKEEAQAGGNFKNCPDRAVEAGRKGGQISRRRKAATQEN